METKQTDKEVLESSDYIWIGKEELSGKFTTMNAHHFRVCNPIARIKQKRVWCTHGDWYGTPVFDDNGKLCVLIAHHPKSDVAHEVKNEIIEKSDKTIEEINYSNDKLTY